MLQYWTANIQSLTKNELLDFNAVAKALNDATVDADAPDEVLSQAGEVEVPQVRPSSRDSIGFSSE